MECNFVFTLWKEPERIENYLNLEIGKDLITQDGIFYFEIARELYKLGHRKFDHMTTHAYLVDRKTLNANYEKRGGQKTVEEITSLLNVENLDAYYEELSRNNALLSLYDIGIDVEKHLAKAQKMTTEELYDFYEYQLSNVFINKIEKLNVEDLSDGYDQYVDKWDKGTMRGYTIGYPILNYRLAGVHKKNLLLHMAHIGNGKTTSSILFYILPAIEHGENVCIIANEQGVEEFRQMILSTVLFNRVNYRKMNRQKFIQGGFSEEDKEHIRLAQNWLKNQEGRISFIETSDYSINNVKKIVKKYSKIGYGLFVFDTLKPEVESADNSWARFSEVAKELFMIAKKEDVAIVATAQLSAESMSRRFLDLSCVGKSRAIAETATQVVMFRTLTDEEKEKLYVYNLHKDSITGKYTNIKNEYKLDPNKDYVVLFTPKNRFGDVTPQIVYERNMSWNTLKEVGLTHISYDGFGFRK